MNRQEYEDAYDGCSGDMSFCPECGSTSLDGYGGHPGLPYADPPEAPEDAWAECRDCGWYGDPDELD